VEKPEVRAMTAPFQPPSTGVVYDPAGKLRR